MTRHNVLVTRIAFQGAKRPSSRHLGVLVPNWDTDPAAGVPSVLSRASDFECERQSESGPTQPSDKAKPLRAQPSPALRFEDEARRSADP